MSDYSLDGIDIDWEFPVWPGSDKRQFNDFTKFLKELRAASRSNNNKGFLISVAVAAPGTIIDKAYDIKEMAEYVFLILLFYYTRLNPLKNHG